MKLKENQLQLIRHLAQFETLDYLSCLHMLDAEMTNNQKALSYAFRPLTKNKYVRKNKDGNINILAKGRALFPEITPLVTLGGGNDGAKRVNVISRTAMFLREAGIDSFASPEESDGYCFVPSTCWRKIRTSILSTARFTGILFIGSHRLAVYDIGDGSMEWQLRAERSLFYHNYSERDTQATGMLFICDDDKRDEVARRIIRTTMWHRKHLIGKYSIRERDKPVRYVKAPIRMVSQYWHVYLTTPLMLTESIGDIAYEEEFIAKQQGTHPDCSEPTQGDYDTGPYRFFVNITTDLLKYVCYFSAAKTLMELREKDTERYHQHIHKLNYAIILPKRDYPILRMYPDVVNMEGMAFYEYGTIKNTQND